MRSHTRGFFDKLKDNRACLDCRQKEAGLGVSSHIVHEGMCDGCQLSQDYVKEAGCRESDNSSSSHVRSYLGFPRELCARRTPRAPGVVDLEGHLYTLDDIQRTPFSLGADVVKLRRGVQSL